MLTLHASQPEDGLSPRDRPERLLKLVSMLEGGIMDGAALADALGVCKRTVFRDIKLLRSANIPIAYDLPHGGYSLRRGMKPVADPAVASAPDGTWIHDGNVCGCPKILPEEIAALLLAVRMAGRLPSSIVVACESAVVKVLAAALPDTREQAAQLIKQIAEIEQPPREAHVLPLRPSG